MKALEELNAKYGVEEICDRPAVAGGEYDLGH